MCVFLRNISDWFLESRVYTIQFYRETKLCRMLSKTCICTYVMIAINTPSSSNTGNRLMTTSISRFSFLRKPIPYVHSPIICFSRSNFTNKIGMQYNPLIELSRLFGEFYNSIISSSTRAFSDWFTIFDYTHSLPPEVHARGYWFSIDAEKNPLSIHFSVSKQGDWSPFGIAIFLFPFRWLIGYLLQRCPIYSSSRSSERAKGNV